MFTNNTSKKLILAVALAVCAIFVFASCTPSNQFTPVTEPTSTTLEGNGGIAVRYGEYIYYVNGYQSSNTAENSYTNTIRTGSVVRIKIDDLEKIIGINDLPNGTSTNKTDAIKRTVAGLANTGKDEDLEKFAEVLRDAVKGIGGAETVIPNFYYNGNTSDTSLNGLWIFNNRIYITTPNSELDVNGNVLNSQLVLVSYAMNGSDMQRHFVFSSNSPQLKLTQSGSDIIATYVLSSQLYTFTISANGTSDVETFVEGETDGTYKKVKVSEVTSDDTAISMSSVNFTENNIFFLDGDGSICQYAIGSNGVPNVLVAKETSADGHDHSASYTIKYANGDYVYFVTSSSTDSTAGLKLYFAKAGQTKIEKVADLETASVALATIPTGDYRGWNEKVVYTASKEVGGVTMYGIWVASGDGTDIVEKLNPAENDSSITLNKLVGNILYYTVDSVSYTLDLSSDTAEAQAYAYSLSTSSTGWSSPDVLTFTYNNTTYSYVFTLSSGAVSVVKYDAETKTNSTSTAITLTTISD